ncbi:MAG: phosphomevalonate kinase, partial [Dermabacter sp.]|nr:phosphomevalonate kinase [Dermabacter sp.]
MSAFEFRAPGKLFVAGEYGVVRAGNPAVLIAVDRVVTARVSPVRRAFGVRVASEQWGEERDYAPVIAEAPASEQPREPIFRALDVFVEYYGPLPALDIHVSSTLDDSDGRKYGFGSSGAVVVATIGATARALNIALSPR